MKDKFSSIKINNDKLKNLDEKLLQFISNKKQNVKWSDIAGLDKQKEYLKEKVIIPIKFPELIREKNTPLENLILLYGPPGTRKTLLSNWLATELGDNFYYISSLSLIGTWFEYESDKTLKQLFDNAKNYSPSVIFFDEINYFLNTNNSNENDSIRKLKAEFLLQMKEMENNKKIIIMGTTNIPWELEPKIKIIFQKKIYIGLPKIKARRSMIKLFL